MEHNANDKVATEIRAELARKRLSQQSLAEQLGISRSSFSRKLNGISNFTMDEFFTVATCLDVTPEYLMGRIHD